MKQIFIALLYGLSLTAVFAVHLAFLAMPAPQAETPTLVIKPQGHSTMIWDVLFTPDGQRLPVVQVKD